MTLQDHETGLDYFGARNFSGAQGRFTSPDWSAVPQPVPYADLTDPQALNLYSYVRNNSLSRTDTDGHCCEEVEDFGRQVTLAPHPLVKLGGYVIIGAEILGSALTNPDVRAAAASQPEVTQSAYQYDPYNNRTDIKEYGYGSGAAGALVRETAQTYINASNNLPRAGFGRFRAGARPNRRHPPSIPFQNKNA